MYPSVEKLPERSKFLLLCGTCTDKMCDLLSPAMVSSSILLNLLARNKPYSFNSLVLIFVKM